MAKSHAPGEHIGKHGGRETKAFKVPQGHKYLRLQRFESLSPEQKGLLNQWFKETAGGRYGAKFLEKTIKHGMPVSPIETEAEKFIKHGIKEGQPISKVEKAGTSFLQDLLGKSAKDQYKQFEAPYLRQFREEIVPGLAERFTGGDAQHSSAFQQALGGAAAGLTENLAALKGNLINQMLNQQLQGANVGLGYAQLPGQRYQNQLNTANLGLGYAQLPMQRYGQQMSAADYMLNQQFQQQQQAMGTQPWGMMAVPAKGKAPSFWQSVAPGIGTLAGAALGSAIPGIGSYLGGMFGGMAGGGVQRMIGAPTNNLGG